MNHESVSFISGNTLSKLLQRPIGSRVAGDIEVKESSCTDFHDEEDVDQLECRRHHNEEIAGDDGLGVIATNVIQRCFGSAGHWGDSGM